MALERYYDINVQWLEVFRRNSYIGLSAQTAICRVAGPLRNRLWDWFFDIADQTIPEDIDIIVSAGGDTLISNVLLAEKIGAKSVFAGSLRRVPPTWLTANIINYPELAEPKNVVLALKPNAVDPLELDDRAQDTIAVFIGGNSGTHTYEIEDWSNLIKLLRTAKQTTGLKLEIITSRRTGRQVESLIKVAKSMEIADDLHLYTEVSAQPIAAYLAKAKWVFCTEDSNSMLTEAISSQRGVINLQPKSRVLSGREQSYLDWLEGEGWMRSVRLSDFDLVHWESVFSAIKPFDRDHLVDLADLLLPVLKLEQEPTRQPQERQKADDIRYGGQENAGSVGRVNLKVIEGKRDQGAKDSRDHKVG